MGEAREDSRQRRKKARGPYWSACHVAALAQLWLVMYFAVVRYAIMGMQRRRRRQFFRCLWEAFSSVRDNKAESTGDCV